MTCQNNALFSLWNEGWNAQSSKSALQSEIISTISHIVDKFGATCQAFLFFSFWNVGKTSASTTSAQPTSQSEGIYTISHIPFRSHMYVNTSLVSCFKPLQLEIKKPFYSFFSFWNAAKNAQSSASATSAQPASQTEGIYTILHIPFGTMCRDCMSTQVWYHVWSQYSYRWRNLFVSFFFFLMKCR